MVNNTTRVSYHTSLLQSSPPVRQHILKSVCFLLQDSISFRECGLNAPYIYTVGAGEVCTCLSSHKAIWHMLYMYTHIHIYSQLLPFWPCGNSELLEVSVRDDVMSHHSAPFKFTETGSILIRTGSGQQQPEPPSPSQQQEVCSV